MATNPQYNAEDKPPPYAPPPYSGPEDASASVKYPPPGEGYNWQQPPPPVTEAPVQAGYPQPPQPGYPVQPPLQNQPGYQAQPGYQLPAGYQAQPGYPGYTAQPGYQYPHPPAMSTTQHTNVTVMQGGPGVIMAPQIAPPDYCLLAWITCLFCFWPVGICAVLKANETRSAIYRGDMLAANQLSLETRKLANMSIAIQITIVVVIVIIRLALIAVY